MHVATWALHDAVMELARERGLRGYRVECKMGPEGETVITLVLPGVKDGTSRQPQNSGRRWR